MPRSHRTDLASDQIVWLLYNKFILLYYCCKAFCDRCYMCTSTLLCGSNLCLLIWLCFVSSSFLSLVSLCVAISCPQSLAAGLTASQPGEKLRPLPLWVSLQLLGNDGIVHKIRHATDLVSSKQNMMLTLLLIQDSQRVLCANRKRSPGILTWYSTTTIAFIICLQHPSMLSLFKEFFSFYKCIYSWVYV